MINISIAIVITFLTVFILTHSINFASGRDRGAQRNPRLSAERWLTANQIHPYF